MKCEDFTQWLQQRLDDRAELTMPPEISDHVVRCDSCRGQLSAWNQISSILPVERPEIRANVHSRTVRSNSIVWVSAAAAVILLALFIGRQRHVEDALVAQAIPNSELSTSDTQVNKDVRAISVDPVSLWQEIQSRDWVAQSMPTVESVRDSFAPMGRSLVQAMTILATGGRDQPS